MNTPDIDTHAVVGGGALALVVTVASILVYRLIEAAADLRDDNNWVFLFVAVIVVGWAVGGYRAARGGHQRSHGATLLAGGGSDWQTDRAECRSLQSRESAAGDGDDHRRRSR